MRTVDAFARLTLRYGTESYRKHVPLTSAAGKTGGSARIMRIILAEYLRRNYAPCWNSSRAPRSFSRRLSVHLTFVPSQVVVGASQAAGRHEIDLSSPPPGSVRARIHLQEEHLLVAAFLPTCKSFVLSVFAPRRNRTDQCNLFRITHPLLPLIVRRSIPRNRPSRLSVSDYKRVVARTTRDALVPLCALTNHIAGRQTSFDC
jgi:hypothetical protein